MSSIVELTSAFQTFQVSESYGRVQNPVVASTRFSLLPDEVLLPIFAQLDLPSKAKLAATCQRFSILLLDASLWKGYINTTSRSITKAQKEQFISAKIDQVSAQFKSALLSGSDDEIARALAQCPQYFLQTALFHPADSRSFSMSGKSLALLAEQFPTLRALVFATADVKAFPAIQGKDLKHFVEQARKLQSLAITGMPQITEPELFDIVSSSSNLREIWIASNTLSDRIIEKICHNNRSLQTIKLSGNWSNVTDKALRAIKNASNGVETLDIVCYNHRFTKKEATSLFSSLSSVTNLSFSGCKKSSNKMINALVTALPHLKTLHLGNCPQISEKALQKLGQLQNLQSLEIADCNNYQKTKDKIAKLKREGLFINLQ